MILCPFCNGFVGFHHECDVQPQPKIETLDELFARTSPIAGRNGWRVDDRGVEWYSDAWLAPAPTSYFCECCHPIFDASDPEWDGNCRRCARTVTMFRAQAERVAS